MFDFSLWCLALTFAAITRRNMSLLPTRGSTGFYFNVCCFAAAVLKLLLLGNENVLKLIRSPILRTEIRVLYALLYKLTNSFRSNKTFKALQQVRTDAQSLPKLTQSSARGGTCLMWRQHYHTYQISNKTCLKCLELCLYSCLFQVEQCVNRLKNMKLCAALQDLADLCTNKIQM